MYIELSPEDNDFPVVPLEVGIFFFFLSHGPCPTGPGARSIIGPHYLLSNHSPPAFLNTQL